MCYVLYHYLLFIVYYIYIYYVWYYYLSCLNIIPELVSFQCDLYRQVYPFRILWAIITVFISKAATKSAVFNGKPLVLAWYTAAQQGKRSAPSNTGENQPAKIQRRETRRSSLSSLLGDDKEEALVSDLISCFILSVLKVAAPLGSWLRLSTLTRNPSLTNWRNGIDEEDFVAYPINAPPPR